MAFLKLTFIKWLIRMKFPRVPRMSTAALAQWLGDSQPASPALLDARSEAEYAVSHLAGAQQVPVTLPTNIIDTLSKDTPIVVYCSVGYRSAQVAQQLQQAGFDPVWNLEGGLFQWVNEGRSLTQNGQPTQQVHPYDATWGKLVHPDKRFPLEGRDG